MSLALRCDICGKFYKPYGRNANNGDDINYITILYKNYINNYIVTREEFDCCPECIKSIIQHIECRKDDFK